MENVIIIVVLVIILGLAGLYVYKAKKSGKKCIGCPANGACSSQRKGGCSCGCDSETE